MVQMNAKYLIVLYILVKVLLARSQPNQKVFLNIWAVKINGNITDAEEIAKIHGYELVEKLEGFPNVFVMRKRDLRNRQRRHAANLTSELKDSPAVLWAEQQRSNTRVKRDFVSSASRPTMNRPERASLSPRFIRNFFDQTRQFMFGFDIAKLNVPYNYNDELWPHQWYIHNPGLSKWDHGITKVWEMGFTGSGVVVTVLDDGLEWRHSDLRSNYDHNASLDVNDNDDDPSPRYDKQNSNAHGTRCAGEIAMAPHNGKCGVGVAYDARIGGIRCLDGDLADLNEARALSFKNDYIDIYSSSWGPSDDGKTVDGPKMLATEALERGITYGRKGRGCIYVWASGNGGSKGDNCNCDGYVSSIYTISIGSVSESGHFPWYGEKCASTLAVAYSSGAYQDRKIPTTDIHDGCTMEHSGTSAAAPIASGILALVLQANPNLTWRDVQHLIVCTSEFGPLADNIGWKRNAAGFLYNSQFGFGLLMAHSLVRKALSWENVPDKIICTVRNLNILPANVPDGKMVKVSFAVNQIDNCPVHVLEHVQVRLTLNSNRRGNLRIFLLSPHDTISVLMHPRHRDNSAKGFDNWNLTSVQFWGENPQGDWQLYIQNTRQDGSMSNLESAELILHGMRTPGGCLRDMPHRRYLKDELIDSIIDKTPEYYDSPLADSSSMFTNTFRDNFEDMYIDEMY